MVSIVEANMDVSVITLSCSHFHKSTSSHVLIYCSHVPKWEFP